MPKVSVPPIDPLDREAPAWAFRFHRSVITAFQRTIQQFNASNADLSDAGGSRISNVGDPAAGRDAVNKQYLEDRLAAFTPGGGAQTVVTNIQNTATTTLPAAAPGADTEILYNDGGVIEADPELTYDKAAVRLDVGTGPRTRITSTGALWLNETGATKIQAIYGGTTSGGQLVTFNAVGAASVNNIFEGGISSTGTLTMTGATASFNVKVTQAQAQLTGTAGITTVAPNIISLVEGANNKVVAQSNPGAGGMLQLYNNGGTETIRIIADSTSTFGTLVALAPTISTFGMSANGLEHIDLKQGAIAVWTGGVPVGTATNYGRVVQIYTAGTSGGQVLVYNNAFNLTAKMNQEGIACDGSIGAGTQGPATVLHVFGTSTTTNYVARFDDASGSPGVVLCNGTTSYGRWSAGASAALGIHDNAGTARFVVGQAGTTTSVGNHAVTGTLTCTAYSPALPTNLVLHAIATNTLLATSSNSDWDIPGLAVTVTSTGTWAIFGSVGMSSTYISGIVPTATIKCLAGTSTLAGSIERLSATTTIDQSARSWTFVATNTTDVVKLQFRVDTLNAIPTVTTNCSLTAMLVNL